MVVFICLFYFATGLSQAFTLIVFMGLGDALNYSSMWPLIP